MSNKPLMMDLLDELDLKSEILHNAESMSPRIYNPTRLLPLPQKSFMGVPSNMESIKDYLTPNEYYQAEILSQKKVNWDKNRDMSIADLIDNTLGAAVRSKVIDPLLSGVYAAATEYISVRYAMPQLAQTLDERGSSLLTAIQEIISPVNLDSHSPQKSRFSFTSLKGGLGTLISTLMNKLQVEYVPETNHLEYHAGIYQAFHGSSQHKQIQSREYDAIILACRPNNSGRLLQTFAPEAAECIATIPLSSPIIIAAHTDLTLPGISGILVPELYPHIHAKAITHLSNKWPHLRDRKIIRISYGRYNFANSPEQNFLPTQEIILQDIHNIVGKSVNLFQTYSFSYPQTLPVIGPQKWKELSVISEFLPSTIALAGAYINGVGIPSCINSALEAVQKIIAA